MIQDEEGGEAAQLECFHDVFLVRLIFFLSLAIKFCKKLEQVHLQ